MLNFMKMGFSRKEKPAAGEQKTANAEKGADILKNVKEMVGNENYEERIKELEAALKKEKKARKKAEKKLKEEKQFFDSFRENIPKIMEAAGWDRETAERNYFDARKRTSCTPKEYFMYRFYNLDNSEQEKMFLIAMQRKIRKKYDVDKAFVNIICNKEKTNIYFAECVKRPWCVNTKVTLKEFENTFRKVSRIIYKPSGGHRGFGIEAFDLNSGNMEEVYNKLSTYPEGVVEEFVKQHPDMARLSPNSVNSVRFVTISSFDEPVTKDGKHLDVAYSIVRIGRGASIVDNLHSGGMVANVDLENGTLATHGADRMGMLWEKHPETGTVIKGFKIPFFEEARAMVEQAILEHKVEGYLGWDLGISENGPVLLEINTCPGSDGLQTAYAQEGKGMKHVMEQYL